MPARNCRPPATIDGENGLDGRRAPVGWQPKQKVDQRQPLLVAEIGHAPLDAAVLESAAGGDIDVGDVVIVIGNAGDLPADGSGFLI